MPEISISSTGPSLLETQESNLMSGDTDLVWVKNYLIAKWRVVSRQKDYCCFCDEYYPKYFLHPTGDDQALFDWLEADFKAREESEALQKKYGINQLWHYLTEFSDDIIDSCVFENDFAVVPVYRDHGDSGNSQLVDRGWITVQIRISPEVTQKQWVGELRDIIAEARGEASIRPLRKKEVTYPTAEDFEIYDLYQASIKSDVNKREIAASIWPEDYGRIRGYQETDSKLTKRYHERIAQCRGQGNPHWETDAYNEVYGKQEALNGNYLVQRVNDALKRVNKAMSRYS